MSSLRWQGCPALAPGRRYAELVGGPLDRELLGITGWSDEQIDGGVALITETGSFASGGRALWDPRPDDPGRWNWEGGIP
ncbi:hypothetical protein [Streptomyces sp. bgisy082]|uniref:hypothetical protein n=1 Tax=Streptomyces sp. bgisy082 TaxID=3413776 RepID=UPI003D713D54